MAEDPDDVYRDFNEPLDPDSGDYEPEKARIRTLLNEIQAAALQYADGYEFLSGVSFSSITSTTGSIVASGTYNMERRNRKIHLEGRVVIAVDSGAGQIRCNGVPAHLAHQSIAALGACRHSESGVMGYAWLGPGGTQISLVRYDAADWVQLGTYEFSIDYIAAE
jgi:hypothetical protein